MLEGLRSLVQRQAISPKQKGNRKSRIYSIHFETVERMLSRRHLGRSEEMGQYALFDSLTDSDASVHPSHLVR